MHGIELKKQSLDNRFNEMAFDFLISLLKQALQHQIYVDIDPDFLTEFNHVRIIDSTKFDVPTIFKEILKGFNGRNTSKAGISIQYEYDIKTGQILNMDLFGATKSDSKYAEKISNTIQPNDLVIRDLGYYSGSNFLKITNNKAYFISRLYAKANAYELRENGEFEKLDFKELYNQMVKSKLLEIEKQVYIGKDRLCVRLIIQLMPEDIYVKRMIKLNKYNKANGHKTSNEIRYRQRFNLFITNIETEKMSTDKICILYKVRWQIELCFKIWKSHMNINKLQKMKYFRYMLIIYTKLLLIFLNSEIVWLIRRKLSDEQKKMLSLFKCMRTMNKKFHNNREMINNAISVSNRLEKIEISLSKNHWQEKRKKRIGLIEIIDLFSCKSIIYLIFVKKIKGSYRNNNFLNINNLSSLSL